MDLEKILKEAGIEEDKIKGIAKAINKEIPKDFVSKEQYNKKIDELDQREKELKELNKTVADTEKIKKDFEDLKTEYKNYKDNSQAKETLNNKKSLFKTELENMGLNKKIINLISKSYDFNSIEIENDKIKGFENIKKDIETEYSDFIGKERTAGAEASNPPVNKNTPTYTLETIRGMNRNQIKENYSDILKSLQSQNKK